ncbi:MAG: ATP-binding cassette domain-containing protein [Acidobacteriota bacterium]
MNGEDGRPAISVAGLTKIFSDPARGRVEAAVDLTFTCRPGEALGLLGPNGAGKTTTLRMLATILTPTAGTATVAGFDVVRDGQEVRRAIGYISPATGLYQRLTPRETLRYFAGLHGLSGPTLDGRVETMVARFDLGKYADTRVEKLSTGNKQKLSLARALVHDPPVLILDEPTTGLDVLVASEAMDLTLEAKAAGKAIVYSTHIMAEVAPLPDRVAVIHEDASAARGRSPETRR